MTRHGDREGDAGRVLSSEGKVSEGDKLGERTYDAGVDTLQSSSSCLSLGLSTVKRVLKVKERLTDGVGEGDGRRVDECDLADAPRLRNETK